MHVPTFSQQVRQYQDRIYGFATHMLHDRQEAQDVTQDVLLRFWEHRNDVDEDRTLSWLMRVTRNACIDALRRRKMQRRVMDVDTDGVEMAAGGQPSPHAAAEAADFQGHLEVALSRLDEPYRSIVILREVQGLAYRDISGALDLPLGTVKGYLHRARKRLRQQLTEVRDYETVE